MNTHADRLVIALCVLALLGMGTFERSLDWQSPFRLWSTAVQVSPNHARPRLNLAHLLMENRDYAGAREQYRFVLRSIQIDRTPLYQSNVRNAALSNIGLLDAVEGHYARSEQYLNLVIAEWPWEPVARVNRGMARLGAGRCFEALADFRLAGVQEPQCRTIVHP